MIKELVKASTARLLSPSLDFLLYFHYHRIRGGFDKEMLKVGELLRSKRRFLDIGANNGHYAFFFQDTFDRVDAFEPLSEVTQGLRAVVKDWVSVHHVALSDREGTKTLHLPLDQHGAVITGLASLETRTNCGDERAVPIKRLDGYGFDDVDLIKIDVEGHEAKVLAGAIETIERTRPILIVEIEQRHLKIPITDIFDYISALGYRGMFLIDGNWVSLDHFKFERHQEPYLERVWDPCYVNNFVFVPK